MPQKKRKCWVDTCQDSAESWGMCSMHRAKWERLVRAKRTRLEDVSDEARYEFYIDRAPSVEIQEIFGVREDCWIWTGGLNNGGYGAFHSAWYKSGKGSFRAHIFQIAVILGQKIDPAEETDHLCRVRPCSNPEHLERVSQRENTLRGTGFSAINAAKTHCNSGHEFTDENTAINALGHRACRTCSRANSSEFSSRPEVKAARLESYVPSTGVRGKGKYQSVRETCSNDHKLEGDNLIQEKRTRNGKVSYVRRCRICTNAKARNTYDRKVGKA